MKGADGTRVRCDPWTWSSAHPKGLVPRGGAVCPPQDVVSEGEAPLAGSGRWEEAAPPSDAPTVSSAGPPPKPQLPAASQAGARGLSPGPRGKGGRPTAPPQPCAARPSPGGVRSTRPTPPHMQGPESRPGF